MLERRVTLLGVLRAALGQRDVLVRIGAENEAPALRSLALVAAGYGLPARKLGTVSVIGPVRMDYGLAIRTVREAAAPALELHRGRLRGLLMASTRPRDPYEVLGVARDADDAQIKKAFRRLARELHPDVNRHDPDAEEKFKEAAEAYEILSDPERRATYDRYGHDGLRSGGYRPELRGLRLDLRPLRRVLRRRRRRVRRRAAHAARCRAATSRSRPRSTLADAARGASVERQLRGGRSLRALPRQRRRAGHADRHLRALRRRRHAPGGLAARRSGRSCAQVPCDVCGGDGRIARAALRALRGPRARGAPAHGRASTSRPGSPTASGSASPAAATPASAAGRPATSTSSSTCAARRALRARRRRPRDGRSTCRRRSRRWGPRSSRAHARRRRRARGPRRHAAGRDPAPARRGMPRAAPRGRTGDLRVVVNVVVPRRLSGEQRELLRAPRRLARPDDNLREPTRRARAASSRRLLRA